VQSWRGQKSEAEAVHQGHRTLLSNGYYLDLVEPASRHYAVDPLSGEAAGLSPEEQKMVLGGEACMWAEMVTPENVDSRLWPRTAAIAERLWSPQDVKDGESMYRRMQVVSERLTAIGLTHETALAAMQERLAPERVDPLRVLAGAVEPVKGYQRASSHKYRQSTPLNTLPDSIPPESMVARNFSLMVDKVVAGIASPDEITAVRQWLMAWKANDARLAPAIQTSAILAPVGTLSQNLSTVAAAGLQALDAFTANQAMPPGWRDQQLAQLEQLRQQRRPPSELLLMVVQPVQKLVQAVK
jgi:hexosaminidase